MLSQEEHYSPWRKQGFLCKPYHGDRGDGQRFATEYLDAAGGSYLALLARTETGH